MSVSNANLMYYYPFDTDFLDYASGTGVSDASATSVTISTTTTKLTSGSLYFNGTNTQGFQIPNMTLTQNGFTIAFWLKFNALPGASSTTRLMDFGYGTTTDFGMSFTNNSLYIYYSTAGNGGGVNFYYAIADTNWHHYCMVIPPNTTPGACPVLSSLYVDGVQYFMNNGIYPSLTALSPCYIGKNATSGYVQLNAYMNQFIMLNRILSGNEVSTIYSNPTTFNFIYVAPVAQFTAPPASPININNSNLLLYYPFDTNKYDYVSGTGVADSVVDISSNISTQATVLSSGSLLFPGLNSQKFQTPNIKFTNNGVTFAMWIKFTTFPKGTFSTPIMKIFDFGTGSAANNVSLYVGYYGFIYYVFNNPSVGTSSTTQSVYGLPDLNWHHYCFTITTSGVCSLYVDGANQSFFHVNYPSLSTLTNCVIGTSNTAGDITSYGTLNFYMNQFLVFNRVITSYELYALTAFPAYVQLSSSATNIGQYYDSYIASPENAIINQPVVINVSYTSPFLTPNTIYTIKNQSYASYGSYNYTNVDMSFSMTYAGQMYASVVTTDNSGNIYVAVNGYSAIYMYNASGGYVKNFPILYNPNPRAIAMDNSNNMIYLTGDYGSSYYFYVLNLATSTVTTWTVNATIGIIFGIAVHPINGGVYVVCNGSPASIGTINVSTGVITPIFSSTLYPRINLTSVPWYGATFDSSGNFYTAIANGGNLCKFVFNPGFISVTQFYSFTMLLITCDRTTNTIYTVNRNSGTGGDIYKITSSGKASLFHTIPGMALGVHFDNRTGKLFVSSNSNVYRYDAHNNTLAFNFSSAPLPFGSTQLQIYDPCGNPLGLSITIRVACFREGTLIKCLDSTLKREVYIPVEHLTRDTFVKTRNSGYKRIEVVGYSTIMNPNADTVIDNRLFVYQAGIKTPELFQDLYITGNHCALLESVPEDLETRIKTHMGDVFKTENFYRVPACLDERAKPHVEPGSYKIWHFALEHDDIYSNYGVYANGLLVESSSIRYMTELSKMTLLQ